MPKAVVNLEDTERYALKTLDGGFVILRRLSFGQWQKRQEMAFRMKLETTKNKDSMGELSMINRKVTEFEFANTIVEHNLEDENGTLLNFNEPTTLDKLNPKIGNEIGRYISELHEFGDDEDFLKS